jgi:hypothetical protein
MGRPSTTFWSETAEAADAQELLALVAWLAVDFN